MSEQQWDTAVMAEMVGVEDDPLDQLIANEEQAALEERELQFGPARAAYRERLKEELCRLVDGCGNGGCGNDDLIEEVLVRILLMRGYSHELVGEFFGISVTSSKHLSYGQRRKPELRRRWKPEVDTPLFNLGG